jgi:hypothetical protein
VRPLTRGYYHFSANDGCTTVPKVLSIDELPRLAQVHDDLSGTSYCGLMLTVVIPWREQPSRLPALKLLLDWYRDNMGDVDFQLVDSSDDHFNLAQSRNLGVASRAVDDVIVINDADTIPQLEPLYEAIAAARGSGLVHLPYTEYHWLGPLGTEQHAAGVPLDECDSEVVSGACSGVYVTTPRTWASHAGQDERFRGWGFEDAAWYRAHIALIGRSPQRHVGRVYALHHIEELREGDQYDANAALMGRYHQAGNDPDAMLQLVAESAANARLLPGF